MALFMSSIRVSARTIFKSSSMTRKSSFNDIRHLYSPTALGVDNLLRAREKVKFQFANIDQKFKEKMKDFTAPESKNMVFTEDLKNMIYLTENTDDDLKLLETMITRFNQQNKELRFGSFVFGPVVMRLYHYLNRPEEALKLFRSEELTGFFDQLVTYQILMDLLLVNNLYDDVIEVFETVKNKQFMGQKFHRHTVVLVTAACYKKNNPEALEYIRKLWAELQQVGHEPNRKAITFCAGLALEQNAPHIALEMLAGTQRQAYVTIRNIKVAALAGIGRPEDAFPILRSVLDFEGPSERRQTFSEDCIEKLRLAVEKSGNKDLEIEFNKIDQQLTLQGCLSAEPLSQLLCSEIHYEPNSPHQNFQRRDRQRLAASFGVNQRSQHAPFGQRRAGLADLS